MVEINKEGLGNVAKVRLCTEPQDLDSDFILSPEYTSDSKDQFTFKEVTEDFAFTDRHLGVDYFGKGGAVIDPPDPSPADARAAQSRLMLALGSQMQVLGGAINTAGRNMHVDDIACFARNVESATVALRQTCKLTGPRIDFIDEAKALFEDEADWSKACVQVARKNCKRPTYPEPDQVVAGCQPVIATLKTQNGMLPRGVSSMSLRPVLSSPMVSDKSSIHQTTEKEQIYVSEEHSQLDTATKSSFSVKDDYQSEENTVGHTGKAGGRKKNTKKEHNMTAIQKKKHEGIRKDKQSGADEDDRPLYLSHLQRFITSTIFEWICVGVIVLNAIIVGWQTQSVYVNARDGKESAEFESSLFVFMDTLFLVFFTCELTLRFSAFGLHLFTEGEIYWTVFETSIVVLGLFDFILEHIGQASLMGGWTYSLRVVRIGRVLRVIRVVRLMKGFQELRLMIFSIMCSAQSLIWTMLILFMCFFIFGVALARGTQDYLIKENLWNDASVAALHSSFAGVDTAILTLFMAMCGGSDWGDPFVLLEPLPKMYAIIFLVYISFSIFVLVNIVTGVFVDNAMQASKKDRDSLIEMNEILLKEFAKDMELLFHEIDADHSGLITVDEFENFVEHPRVRAYFDSMQLDISGRPPALMFELCKFVSANPASKTDAISIEEFIAAIRQLSHEARAVDSAMLQREIYMMRQKDIRHLTDLHMDLHTKI